MRNSILEYLQENAQAAKTKRVPTREEVEVALWSVGPLINVGRHWLGPCRVLMDCGFIPEGRYDLFCELIGSVLPDHKHLPQEAELRRMAVGCFSKSFEKWTDEKAPQYTVHTIRNTTEQARKCSKNSHRNSHKLLKTPKERRFRPKLP